MNEDSLFHAALSRPNLQERAAFLDRVCADQPKLRAAVEALLVAHAQSGSVPPSAQAGATTGFGASSSANANDDSVCAGDTEGHKASTKRDDAAPPREAHGLPGVAAAPVTADVPRQIGRYEIRKVLGRGGMGMVYLAHDPELDRLVALKVPRLSGPDAEERFLREARSAAAVSHPHLCPVYDAGRADGVLYLAMAYVPGAPLSEVLRERGPMTPHAAAALVARVARGMAEAHRHGIVHRDLKPGNILLDNDGEPIVTDFGLAFRAAVDVPSVTADPLATLQYDPRLTQAGVVIGTPAYMPPEQARGDLQRIGPASDVYALGAILFELLTGRPPFAPAPLHEMVRQIEAQPVPAPSTRRRGVPPGLDAICRQALAKDPAQRIASMATFAQALAPFAAAAGWRRWRRVVAVVAACLAFVCTAVVVYVATDNGTIEIRISDPSADVQVSVDDQVVTVTQNGRVTTLRAGAHTLLVRGPDFEAEARTFRVLRGKNPVLEVELKPKRATAAVPKASTTAAVTPDRSPKASDRARLAGLLRSGENAIRQGRFLDLGALADEALKIDPESPGALALRATNRTARNDVVNARADVEAALKLNPETYRALFIRAHLLGDEGKFDEAIADATVAIRLRPADPSVWLNRSVFFLRRGDYRQAIADATVAIERGFAREHAHLNRAAAYACLGQYAKAVAEYDAAHKMAPTSAAILIQRSAAQAKAGNARQAAADWEEARTLDPTLTDDRRAVIPPPPRAPTRKKLTGEEQAHHDAALAAAAKADADQQGDACQKSADVALRIDPTSPDARIWRLRGLIRQRQYAEVIKAADEAIRATPEDAWPYIGRGTARSEIGAPAAGIADLTIAITLAPANAIGWGKRGCAFSVRGQYHQAVADISEALRRDMDQVLLANRADALLHLGQYGQALADYQTIAKREPRHAAWLLRCSAIRARLGDVAGSRADRDRASKIDAKVSDQPLPKLPQPIPPPRLDPEAPAVDLRATKSDG